MILKIYDLFMKLSVKNDFSHTIPQGFRRLDMYGALLSVLELQTVAHHYHWMENGVKKWFWCSMEEETQRGLKRHEVE